MTVSSTAKRRLKNAVVLPNTPALLNTDLNAPLNATKPQVMAALGEANTQLNALMTQFGLSQCRDLLAPSSSVYQDISDIYEPPAAGTYSGHDLIDYLRGDPELKQIPTVVMTGMPKDQVRVIADAVFHKPLNFAALVEAVKGYADRPH